ncbi:MAG TPA: trans-aconitate 2-methyltransferase [Actinomadura sp.]|jgi:trans-aconitate 2-methyltransferase|nr:trans-aconitate 2-methyltransferase [Actinomadura sp.]
MPSGESVAPWDPRQYGLFADERSRPFFDLVARVGATAPARVVDLGCGSGELTAALSRRWPSAVVEGIDGSAEMITEARRHAGPGLRFSVGDIARWMPDEPIDLIVSNAALHWVPGHVDLLPTWAGALKAGGRLAFQVPGNFEAPSHTILRDLCRSPRWGSRLAEAIRWRPVREPADYLELLTRHGLRVEAWETTYIQVLPGDDPVLEWVKGTALRPVLALLGTGEAAEFLAGYSRRLREAYPAGPYGTVFPFRRIFVVARRPD